MSENLKGKVALVTGASRGIGRTVALALAKAGASVVVNYMTKADDAARVVEEIASLGAGARAIQADVSRVPEQIRLFDEAVSHFGRVDILVNNAGIMIHKPVSDVTEAEFDRIFAVNVKSVFFLCQQAASRLSAHGRIINFSSSATARMLPNYGVYVATKGAVEQLGRTLAKELAPRGITVNTVSPGPTETEMFLTGKTPEQIQFHAAQSAFGRLARPNEIAEAVVFLASDAASWITGQNIRVNGGLT